MCPTLADSMALTGRRQRHLQIWQRTTQRCVRCRRPLRLSHLGPARIVEGERHRRSHLPQTPRQRSQTAVFAHGAIGDEHDSAILRQEDRRETDRPHSNREARREVESHRSVTRREAVHRLPNVKTIRKHIRVKTQGQARRINQSCLWQKTTLRMKDLLALRSLTATAPSTRWAQLFKGFWLGFAASCSGKRSAVGANQSHPHAPLWCGSCKRIGRA